MDNGFEQTTIDSVGFRQTLPSRYVPCKTAMRSNYQIDVFPNGKGDAAYVIRYGQPGNHKILVYNGGTPKTGKEIVSHIRHCYQTDFIDDLVSSHVSSDLSLGICDILDGMKVKQLWMHRPWAYCLPMAGYFFRMGKPTKTAIAAYFEEKFSATHLLELIADDKGVAVSEPFQGSQIGPFTVMSPHRDWYINKLVPELADVESSGKFTLAASKRFLGRLKAGQIILPPELESWESETLQEGHAGRPEHESSVVLYGKIGNRGVLLTGDAGLTALTNSARYAESRNLLIPDRLGFVQMPHHGEARHVSPAVLDRLIGPKYRERPHELTAVIATKSDKARNGEQLVANALIRRGATVINVAPTSRRLFVDQASTPDESRIIHFVGNERAS